MARHGKKPSEENTSSRTPRTLAGSATTNASADGTDAATSSSAVDSSTVNGTFASNADNNTASNTDSSTGNAHTNSASNEADATEAGINAIDTNTTETRTIVSGDTAETSNRQSLEADAAVKSNESRRARPVRRGHSARHQRWRRLDEPACKALLSPDHYHRSRRGCRFGCDLRIHRHTRIAANA